MSGQRANCISVLDHGSVTLLDYMGSDEDIVASARVSYGEGTKGNSSTRELIRYLMRHQHWSPFEMAQIKFKIVVPMDCWRQFIRHRTAKVNEYSTRYSVAITEKYSVSPDSWRKQSTSKKQGSDGVFSVEEGIAFSKQEQALHRYAQEVYESRLAAGMAREQARKDLPLSNYTAVHWSMDLRNLLHFLELRLDSHAQQEIREYAQVIAHFVQELFPLTWEAFDCYHLQAVTLSGVDRLVLKQLYDAGALPCKSSELLLLKSEDGLCTQSGRILKLADGSMSKGELQEFIEKLEKLSLVDGF